MIYSIILAIALTGQNSYVWTGQTSTWQNPDNWGAMDYPHTGDIITVGQTWGVGGEPIHTINLGGTRDLSTIYAWSNYDTTFINGTLVADDIVGDGNLIISSTTLNAGSININSLTISNHAQSVPEPSSFILLCVFILACILFYRKKYA